MFAGFGSAEDTNVRFRQLLDAGQTGLSIAYDMPTLYGYDTDDPEAEGEFGTCGVAVSSLADMELLLDGPAARPREHVDDDQRAGGADLGDVHRRRGEAGRAARRPRGHDPERHPQGVRRPEGVPVPARAVDAARRRHHRVRLARAAALEHRLDQRLPHPRGGLDGGPGAGVHDRRRHGLRGGVHGPRPAGRRVRAAALVLLQQPLRLLRGDRQVPGVPPDLVEADERALPGRERALDVDALPHPDRRRLADAAAAAEQPDPRRDAGAGRDPRRDAVAPHGRLRRGARGPDRRGRAARAAPAADPRRGDRRRLHRRPAGRLVVRRGADQPRRARRLALPRRDRPPGRDGRGDRRGLPAARDRGRRLPLPARVRRRRAGHRRGQPLRQRRARDGAGARGARGLLRAAHGPPGAHPARSATPRRSGAALDGLREAAAKPGSSANNLMPHFLRCAERYATLGEQCRALREVFGEYREPVSV